MSYSTAGHNLSQLSTVDADGILRLFTDSVAAYVENAASQRTPARAVEGAGGETHNPLNSTLRQAGVVCSLADSTTPIVPQGKQKAQSSCAPMAKPSTSVYNRIEDSIPQWEVARQRNASQRGYAYVAPDVQANLTTDIQHDTDCLRTDGELARIAVGVKHSYLFQRWLVLNELNRTTGRQGYTRAEFDTALRQYGVKGCDAYNARLLRRGHGFYWTLHNDMVYPSSYVFVAKEIVKHAAKHGLHDLYATNAPGSMRPMYIRVSGSAADFEAATLNAWYAARNNPTISRLAICALFNRSEGTLRQLERRAGIQITTNMVETTDSSAVPLKPDGSLRSDVYRTIENGRTVYHYRLANTYTSTRVKQHSHRGQSRKVSYLFKQWIESDLLASITGQGSRNASGKLNRSGRFYCETEKRAERSRRQGNANTLVIPNRPGEGRAVIWCVYQ